MNQIEVGEVFTVSKTDSRFVEVKFRYGDGSIWEGCFPLYYPPMSIQFDLEEAGVLISAAYEKMAPDKIHEQVAKTRKRWSKSSSSETYNVFNMLLSGRWECRSCGAGKINDQPAARIRDIKKNGFVVATRSKVCSICRKKQYHDILVVFDIKAEAKAEYRKPISPSVKERIVEVLGRKDVFFGANRPSNEFVIDHKFPSQRWAGPESDNNNLSVSDIKKKFQLLTNQSNMLKSRLCDSCCKTGIRPDFLGVRWFYYGGENWVAGSHVGSGCYGCPWYDLEEWKISASRILTGG